MIGKWVFALLFAGLALWIWMLPAKFLGEEEETSPIWKSVRAWAIVVALAQMAIYLYWG